MGLQAGPRRRPHRSDPRVGQRQLEHVMPDQASGTYQEQRRPVQTRISLAHGRASRCTDSPDGVLLWVSSIITRFTAGRSMISSSVAATSSRGTSW